MEGLEWLIKFDKVLLVLIHNDSDHQFLDGIFLTIRNELTWVPLYLFMFYFSVRNLKKSVLLFIVLTLLTFACCDQLSANLLKPIFERPRPCFNEEIRPLLRNIIDCGGPYSFPSSHATNHFGLAGFWYWSIKSQTGRKWPWLWFWAAAICYAQVYVAKHYPLDVLAGGLLGTFIGALMAWLFNRMSATLQGKKLHMNLFQVKFFGDNYN